MDQQIRLMIQAMEEKKAADVVCLNLKGKSDLCDYMLVCSAENDKQTKAIADHLEASCLKHLRFKPAAVEGKSSGFWILLDYGRVMIHVFHKDYRSYYAIEKIWPGTQVSL